MTYEIAIRAEHVQQAFSGVKNFDNNAAAVAWCKDFANDWWPHAEYLIFCRDTQAIFQGAAN